MNTITKLPSGKMLDMSRFVALVPSEDISQEKYELILEGYPHVIYLEKQDIDVVTKILERRKNNDNDITIIQQKELLKQDEALEVLKNRMTRNQNMSNEESLQREKFFTEFKQIVDTERHREQKLYE